MSAETVEFNRHAKPLLPTSEYRVWLAPCRAVLRMAAAGKKFVTYREVADWIGFPEHHPAVFFSLLATISADCEAADEPVLTVLVVNAETMLASRGIVPWVEDIHGESLRVFEHAEATARTGAL